MSDVDEANQKALLKRPFYVSADIPGLTPFEISLLRRHGTWLNALARGVVSPTTPAQIAFVEVSKGERSPVSEHEKLWVKYFKARETQTERLERLIFDKKLNFDQLRSIESTVNDFDFSKEALHELSIQISEGLHNRRLVGSGAFIVYSTTDGQG